jgi:nicotinamide-nucleotide adenylyltransferase
MRRRSALIGYTDLTVDQEPRQRRLAARIGMIARWKPVHLGHSPVLRALCDRADQALIGIGSVNRYDYRNPFTADETEEMIRLALGRRANYRIVRVNDLEDGPRWRATVVGLFGSLDLFATDNDYVRRLLADDYRVVRPVELIDSGERVPIDGKRVRYAMARGEDWRALVPPEVAEYIARRGLAERFRREFGLRTLAAEIEQEESHVLVG